MWGSAACCARSRGGTVLTGRRWPCVRVVMGVWMRLYTLDLFLSVDFWMCVCGMNVFIGCLISMDGCFEFDR